MTVPTKLPPKKAVAEALLRGPSMFVHLDPRREGVLVPPWFKRQPQLVLQLGLNMAIPIRDLAVSEQGVSGTLSFNRSPFWCNVPWGAVYALVGEDGRGMVWPDDVPPELPLKGQRPGGGNAGDRAPAAAPSRPKLRVAVAPPADAPPPARAEPPAEPVAPDATVVAPAAPPGSGAPVVERAPNAPRGRRKATGGKPPAEPAAASPRRRARPEASPDGPPAPARRRRGRAADKAAEVDRVPSDAPGAASPAQADEPRARRPRPRGRRARAVAPPTQAELPLDPAVERAEPVAPTAAAEPDDASDAAEPHGATPSIVESNGDGQGTGDAQPKPRRTLPPYLRVIK